MFTVLLTISFGLAAVEPVSRLGEAIDLISTNGPESAGVPKADRGQTKTFSFTEAEVNEFVKQLIKRESGRSGDDEMIVRSAVVRLKDKRVVQVDVIASFGPKVLKLLGPEEDSLIGKTLKQCVGFDNSLYLEAILSSAKGTAFIKVLKVKIKGLPLPDAALQKVIKRIGEGQKPRVDLDRPFPLPNGIEKIDIQPGSLGLRVKVL